MAITEGRYYEDIICGTKHQMCKYIKNIIEQDHMFIKKNLNSMLGFKTRGSVKKTM